MNTTKKRIGKKTGISLFTVAMLIMAAVIVFYQNPLADPEDELVKKMIACGIIFIAVLGFALLYDKITVLPAELFQSRHLIWKLAKNDFKKRYAGSYLGAVWAMVQPVVTVLVYWFVFEVGFRSPGTNEVLKVPFLLYLVAGIVPWFFFQDALTGGTNSLLEYSYLVKKVVFKISVLPIVKIISAMFVHIFFVCFITLFCIYFVLLTTFFCTYFTDKDTKICT